MNLNHFNVEVPSKLFDCSGDALKMYICFTKLFEVVQMTQTPNFKRSVIAHHLTNVGHSGGMAA